jgi:methylated-DNA-[protein]-cysteine S-methyltransferase
MCTKPGDGEERRRVGVYRTDLGEGRVAVNEHGVCLVELPGPGIGAGESVTPSSEGGAPLLAEWTGLLEEYFRGERLSWGADEIPWEGLKLREFDRAVYIALLDIRPGETVSYGELAQMAGYPRAARAVGSAMARNPIPVVIPCHRVIRSDGRLGNYGNDPEWKARLLKHERSVVEKRKSR